MKIYSYALTAVALAMCQICTAQSLGQTPTPAPAPTVAEPTAATYISDEPRIIRGNDQVIAPAKPIPWLDGSPVTLNFEEAPIAEVVRTILGDILKVSYVLHPPLAGTVTLATRAPVSPDQAVFLLESALSANGLALVRDARGSYHVGRADALKGVGASVRQVGKAPLQPGSGVIVVPLQYIGAAEMASILRPLIPPDGLVRVDTVRNLLVMVGTRTQAEGWKDLIDTFDVDLLKGMSVGVFPLKYATVKEVESALQLMSAGAGSATAPAAAGAVRPAAGGTAAAAPAAMLGEGNPLFGALRIMPIERINSVLVVTPRAAYLDEARRWIERLDRPSDNAGEAQLFIYQVQNVNARHLASVLSGIFGGQTNNTASASSGVAPKLGSATGSTFGQNGSSTPFGSSSGLGMRTAGQTAGTNTNNNPQAQAPVASNIGNIRVMADELNNSVLVWSTKAEYSKIESTLKRLDLPLTQVLIEATIVEVTLSDDLKYGLQWAFSGSLGKSGYAGNGLISGVGAKENIFGAVNPVTVIPQGFTYTLSNPFGNVRAVLNALATKSLINVISSPSLMVLDNHTATIKVGNQEPVRSSVTTSSSNINNSNINDRTSNIQYRDTGVNLVVTPSVNAGNIVTMQVDQTVTDLGPTKESADGQPAFLERQISSKVAVRSGETIVLGGLIKDSKKSGKDGVPYLHDIPVLGNLFGVKTSNDSRTELLVIITPRVVRSDIDIRSVSEDLRDRMKGLSLFDTKNVAPTPMAPPLLPLSSQ